MFLLFNTLSRFVTAFLTRKTCLSISWQHSPSTVVLEPKKVKSVTASNSPAPGPASICHYADLSFSECWISSQCLHVPLWSSSVQFGSVAQSCPTLWDPMDHRTPGLPVHHQLPEFTQIHDPHQDAPYFLYTFYHYSVIPCISEVADISPGKLDSSLGFIQPSISHDVRYM